MRYQNPGCLLVISTWQSMENWLACKENKEKKEREADLERFLESPTEYDEYIFGT